MAAAGEIWMKVPETGCQRKKKGGRTRTDAVRTRQRQSERPWQMETGEQTADADKSAEEPEADERKMNI